MTQFINFNDTGYKFLSIKLHNFDDIMTQFIRINDTIFSNFKYKNDMIYENQ